VTGSSPHRKVKAKVVRKPDGWQPVIYIGEVKFYMLPCPTKSEARRVARTRASFLNQAGPI
jgi:hypothetical protein